MTSSTCIFEANREVSARKSLEVERVEAELRLGRDHPRRNKPAPVSAIKGAPLNDALMPEILFPLQGAAGSEKK